jgi:hypothetical protein
MHYVATAQRYAATAHMQARNNFVAPLQRALNANRASKTQQNSPASFATLIHTTFRYRANAVGTMPSASR